MHLKRMAAPQVYKIPRKGKKFAPRPVPGAHPSDDSLPLILVLRDYLGYALTRLEARKIVHRGEVLIDGRAVKEPNFPVGLMDTISIPRLERYLRVLPVYGRGLQLIEVPREECAFKLCYVKRKMHVKGGGLQFTLHDGRNVLFKEPSEEVRKIMVGDTLRISLPSQEVLSHLAMGEGRYGLVIAGSKSGLHGRISKIDLTLKYPAKPIAQLETQVGTISTILPYVMSIGEEEPWLKLP